MKKSQTLLAVPAAAALMFSSVSCETNVTSRPIGNPGGQRTNYVDPSNSQLVTTRTEGRDVEVIGSKMARSILAAPFMADHAGNPPRIVLDAAHMKNLSSEAGLSTDLLTEKLRAVLNRNSDRRLVFVSRESDAMVDEERLRKRQGKADTGASGVAETRFGADYRLVGKITSQDQAGNVRSNYVLFTFELVDLETGAVAWGDEYTFMKEGQESVLYR
jgi:PBP1b-binding outer membrane lipoprotein LpoB